MNKYQSSPAEMLLIATLQDRSYTNIKNQHEAIGSKEKQMRAIHQARLARQQNATSNERKCVTIRFASETRRLRALNFARYF